MRIAKHPQNDPPKKILMNYPSVILFAVVAGICLGIFFFVYQSSYKPIPREEALVCSGEFEKYEASDDYCKIFFKDGSEYDVYPHTVSEEFRNAMQSLEPGTGLYISVNPNNDFAVEVKTDTAELLNFELTQKEMESYSKGYAVIAFFLCISGVVLIAYVIGSSKYKQKENERLASKHEYGGKAKADSAVMRCADAAVKSRILLEADVKGYKICYRRVKSVNELVINGRVYDEKKGVVEFEHRLCAVIDGHTVEAGYDEDSYSYILFDGELVKRKRRWI